MKSVFIFIVSSIGFLAFFLVMDALLLNAQGLSFIFRG